MNNEKSSGDEFENVQVLAGIEAIPDDTPRHPNGAPMMDSMGRRLKSNGDLDGRAAGKTTKQLAAMKKAQTKRMELLKLENKKKMARNYMAAEERIVKEIEKKTPIVTPVKIDAPQAPNSMVPFEAMLKMMEMMNQKSIPTPVAAPIVAKEKKPKVVKPKVVEEVTRDVPRVVHEQPYPPARRPIVFM